MFPTDYAMNPAELGPKLEERGFESLWVAEHTHIPCSRESPWPGGAELPKMYYDCFAPLLTLAAVGATTKTLKLGTGIQLVAQHDPITLAKEIATLDQMTGGRFLLRGRRRVEPRRACEPLRLPLRTTLESHAGTYRGHEGHLDPGQSRLPRRIRELRRDLLLAQAVCRSRIHRSTSEAQLRGVSSEPCGTETAGFPSPDEVTRIRSRT